MKSTTSLHLSRCILFQHWSVSYLPPTIFQHLYRNQQICLDATAESIRQCPHWTSFARQHALTRLSSLIWTAQSSTAPMPSSNTGIRSERKSAWILKSSLPPLMEDAQSTCWRSWNQSSLTGSVRKPSFFCPFVPLSPFGVTESKSCNHCLSLAILSREANGLKTINQVLTLKSTKHEWNRQPTT